MSGLTAGHRRIATTRLAPLIGDIKPVTRGPDVVRWPQAFGELTKIRALIPTANSKPLIMRTPEKLTPTHRNVHFPEAAGN